MPLTLPASNTLKQILGGVAGMAIAAGIYYGLDYTSSLRTPAFLLTPTNAVTEQVGKVSVSDKNIDPELLARLTQRAKLLQAQVNPNGRVTTTRQTVVASNPVTSTFRPAAPAQQKPVADAATHPGAPLAGTKGGQLPSSGVTLMQSMLLSALLGASVTVYGMRKRSIAHATVRA